MQTTPMATAINASTHRRDNQRSAAPRRASGTCCAIAIACPRTVSSSFSIVDGSILVSPADAVVAELDDRRPQEHEEDDDRHRRAVSQIQGLEAQRVGVDR